MVMLAHMKIKQQKRLTFGDLIAAAFRNWGADQAGKLVRLAINAHWVIFRKPQTILNNSAKGRNV